MRSRLFALLPLVLFIVSFSGCDQSKNQTKETSKLPEKSAVAFSTSTANVEKALSYDVISGRLVENLNRLKGKVGIKDDVKIKCYGADSQYAALSGFFRNAFMRKDENGQPVIFVSGYFAGDEPSDETINIMIAHELGHLVLGHCLDNYQLTPSYFGNENEFEGRADMFALNLVGERIFRRGFKDMYGSTHLTWRLNRIKTLRTKDRQHT